MEPGPTTALKIRALPWALAGDGANIVYVSLTFAGPVFLLFLDKLGMDKPQIGLVLSIIPFCGLIAVCLAPAIARVGYKRTYLAAWGTRKIVLALMIATPWVLHNWGKQATFTFVTAVILLFALCRSIAMSAFSAWVQELVPNSVRGKFSAAQNIVFVLLGATTLAVAGAFLGNDPQLSQFRILFVAGLVFGLLSVAFHSALPGGGSVRGDDRQRADFGSMWEALRDRQFQLFLATGGLVTLGWMPLSMGGFLPLFLKEQVGLDPDQVLYFNAVIMGSGLVSCFVWGWAVDRYGSKPVLLLTLLIMCLYPLGLWLLPRHGALSFQSALVVAVIVGLVLPGWSVAYTRLLYVKLIPPAQRSAYGAIHIAWTGLMSGLAPLTTGWVLQYTADFTGSLGFLILDPYTPLMWSGLALTGLSIVFLTRLAGDSDVPVTRFAGMFIQGNALAAMQALVAYQFGGVEGKRISTIERLGKARSPLSVDELIQSLRDPGFNVRFEAIVSIARTRPDPRLTDALVGVLRSGEPDMRIAAAWALGRSGERPAIGPLREALDSAYPLLRARAARALGTLGDQASAHLLRKRLGDEPDPGLKLAFASALGALRRTEALGPVLSLLTTLEDPQQRLEGALAVASIAGRDNWFVLLARRVERDAGDALGGVLLSMRRKLLRSVESASGAASGNGGRTAEVRDLIDRCVRAFGDNDLQAGAEHLRSIIAFVPRGSLAPAADTVLRHAAQQLVSSDALRLDYAMLCLHALHTGFGAGAPQSREHA